MKIHNVRKPMYWQLYLPFPSYSWFVGNLHFCSPHCSRTEIRCGDWGGGKWKLSLCAWQRGLSPEGKINTMGLF